MMGPVNTARALVLLLPLAACSPEHGDSPPVRELVLGFVPSFASTELDGAPSMRPGTEQGRVLVTTILPASQWTDHGAGLWSLPRPLSSVPRAQGARSRVWMEGERLARMPRRSSAMLDRLERRGVPASLTANADQVGFHVTPSRIYLTSPPGRGPRDGRIEQTLNLGGVVDGRWRTSVAGITADGVPLLNGGRETLHVGEHNGGVLRARVRPHDGEPTLRILHGNDLLQEVQIPPGGSRIEVALPHSPDHLEIILEASGDQGLLFLQGPTIGPPDVGTYERRPWSAPVDIVLLLADTLRADALAPWGGHPLVTPHLNELARSSRRFMQARTTSTWTLPAHASLFTGLHPTTLGVRSLRDRLPASAVTLAEHLRAKGYRTVAITDGAFVSETFGLDQGFETFTELPSPGVDPDLTVAAVREALSGDDGRPLFLFVQSYRPHERGEFGAEVEQRFRGVLPLPEKVNLLDSEGYERLKALVSDTPRGTPLTGPDYEELVAPTADYYLGAAAESDLAFARVLEILEASGLVNDRVLAFTSDHGESLGEHGVVGHGTGVFESQAWIPLLISAPALPAEADHRPVSLVDLPRTLTGLAGLSAHPSWGGIDLQATVPPDRPVIISQLYPSRVEDAAVVVEGKKAIFRADDGIGELYLVYDLESDPLERNPGSVEDLPSSPEGLRDLIQEVHSSGPESLPARVTGERRSQLEALGYVDDGEDPPR